MSKIAEQKALEAYPILFSERNGYDNTFKDRRESYIKGYDQAMKDIQEQAEKSVIEKSNGEVTIEDLVAYNQGFKIGRELTIQDFMEKAEMYLKTRVYYNMHANNIPIAIQDFKNYMQDESEN